MKKPVIDDLYGMEPEAGPLFAELGPFEDSTAERDKYTQLVGEIIWRHKGRGNPITIDELRRKTDLADRSIKGIVESLVMIHNMLVGSSRVSEKWGYFIVMDELDFKAACGAYEKQIETMQKRMSHFRGIASERGILR